MATIRINVCGNSEFLGAEVADYRDAIDAALDGRDFLEVELRLSFAYWSGGQGYGHGLVAVEIIGWGTVKASWMARKAAAWLAQHGMAFPSSAEIEEAFEVKDSLMDGVRSARDAAMREAEEEVTR